MFNVALSEDEIKNIYRNGLGLEALAIEVGDKITITWGALKGRI